MKYTLAEFVRVQQQARAHITECGLQELFWAAVSPSGAEHIGLTIYPVGSDRKNKAAWPTAHIPYENIPTEDVAALVDKLIQDALENCADERVQQVNRLIGKYDGSNDNR